MDGLMDSVTPRLALPAAKKMVGADVAWPPLLPFAKKTLLFYSVFIGTYTLHSLI
jgi:hypothetical protein